MFENEEDDTLPLQYLNNENPYAFCTDYHKNTINMTSKKEKLSAIHRLQPTKLQMKMDLNHLDAERKQLLADAIEKRREMLVMKGLAILNANSSEPELLFDQNIHNEHILEIALELKKMKLIYHQMRLRARVSHVLQAKVSGNLGKIVNGDEKVIVDNLKEGLIFVQLKELNQCTSEK